MFENKNFCDSWNKIVRYLCAIPFAAICGILAGTFLPYIFTMYFLPGSLAYEITRIATSCILFVYIVNFFLYSMPPKHKLWFSIPFNAIWGVLSLFAVIANIFDNFNLENLFSNIVTLATIVILSIGEVKDYIKDEQCEKSN